MRLYDIMKEEEIVSDIISFTDIVEITPENWKIVEGPNFKKRYQRKENLEIPRDEGLKIINKNDFEKFYRLSERSTLSYELLPNSNNLVHLEGSVFSRPQNS